MKILISSHSFYPSIGGIEIVTEELANEFSRLGHEVRVVTETPAKEKEPDCFCFQVIRRPGPVTLLRNVAWCDVYLHNHMSLRAAWPLLFLRRSWVIVHQTWLRGPRGAAGWNMRVKRALLRFARSIAISRAIADDLKTPCVVIGNPYRDDTFRRINEGERPYDLVFLGRFVPDKGVRILLHTLARLREEGRTPRLLLIGSGPEESALRALNQEFGLIDQVEFAGAKLGKELALLLNQCRVMVVPSLWEEPFGIVALEGIACGCVVIGSQGGGLKDAIGPCGLTFPNGDVDALAKRLREVLGSEQIQTACRKQAAAHLSRYTGKAVAAEYLRILETLVAP